MRGLATALVLTLALLLSCGGDDDPEPTTNAGATNTPTPVPEASATPEPTAVPASPTPADPVGPLVVMLSGNPRQRLHVYDAGAGAMLLDQSLPTGDDYQGDARAGRVLVASQGAVTEVRLDGSVREILRSDGNRYQVSDVAISPDGRTAAVSVMYWPDPGVTPTPDDGDYVLFLDIDSGDELHRMSRAEFAQAGGPLDGFVGSFYWLAWRDDGAGVVVSGATFSEGPGGWATVFVDGRVESHDLQGFGHLSPDAQLAAHGEVPFECMAVASRQLNVRELETGADVALLAADEGFALTAWDWSPDGRELLVSKAPLVEAADPAQGEGLCPDFEAQGWLAFDVTEGTTRAVEDLGELYERWHAAGPMVTMDCGGSTRYLVYTRWVERFISCWDAEGPELMVDGRQVADGNQFQVIGIIDAEP